MKVRFNCSLGRKDADACRLNGTPVDCEACVEGAEVDIPDGAYELLSKRYGAIVEAVEVKGESKQPEVKAVPPAAKAEERKPTPRVEQKGK